VFCENRTEYTNTLCGQNVKFWCVKAGCIYSNHWALEWAKEVGIMYNRALDLSRGTDRQAYCLQAAI
jgi:hypothetical protein